MTLPDGDISKITMGEEELRRIINFDETDHPFTTQNEKRDQDHSDGVILN